MGELRAVKRGWDKVLASQLFGLSSKTQWLSGLYYADFISFYSPTSTVRRGRRNRILTNYRFLSHSLFFAIKRLFGIRPSSTWIGFSNLLP